MALSMGDCEKGKLPHW